MYDHDERAQQSEREVGCCECGERGHGCQDCPVFLSPEDV